LKPRTELYRKSSHRYFESSTSFCFTVSISVNIPHELLAPSEFLLSKKFYLPLSLTETDIEKTTLLDLAQDLQKIRKDFNISFDNALKTRGIKK